MVDILKATFSQDVLDKYLKIVTKPKFHIYDTAEKCCEIQDLDSGAKHFTVINPTERAIHFLAIDRGIIPASQSIRRCDCAVFDHKTFCFIEIKVVNSSLQRSEANREAKEQLRLTILYFQENIPISTRRLEAYVCVGTTASRPARRASDLNEILEFDELGVALFHGNEKRFA